MPCKLQHDENKIDYIRGYRRILQADGGNHIPGPVGLTDADGQLIHCSGMVTFNVTIAGRTTSVTAWVTNAIGGGQLIIGSGVMEDLDLHLQDVPDDSNPRGHAQETRTVRMPGGGPAVARSGRTDR